MLKMNRIVALLVAASLAVLIVPAIALTAPSAPAGVTAISLDGKVGLSWGGVSGASSYKVYRGTSAASVTTQIGTSATATYTDTTASNGTTYYYAVKATASIGGDSASSTLAAAKPLARSCSTGNTVAVENCTPGTAAWKLTAAGRAYDNGIEGFASATSVNQGASVDLKVNTGPAGDGKPYRVDIYRMGWYGGTHGRLVGTIPNQVGVAQDSCQDGSGNTGLVDCSNWTTTTTISTTTSWPSGVYWLKLVREDNNTDNTILLIVRQDGSHSDAVYEVPTSTYEAYNSYGGKSLYDYNSVGAPTVAGTARAVKVSYDRPYVQSYTDQPDWFADSDLPNVGFLERSGYNATYITDTDLHATATQASDHKAFLSGAHSEYWSTEMRNNVKAARDAGVGVFFTGANQIYWRARFEASPFSGASNRVQAVYKTTQSGATDPVSPTGTWRDPAGINAPENALAGSQYVGDNDSHNYPLVVPQAMGQSRIWRHTSAATLAAGDSITYGTGIVGWEWNDRAANGQEPAGTTSWSSSPVAGNVLQDAGKVYATGAATATGTAYKAASGAWVVSSGTNYWGRGLDTDVNGTGEPTGDVQQATTNILADMNTRPTTPVSGVVVDPASAPVISSTSPASGATGVATTGAVTATFDQSIDPNSLTATTFFLKTSGGATVAATLSYNDATHKATLTPNSPLGGNASYTATIKGGAAGIAGWGGVLAADKTWSFTTGAGTPPTVGPVTPADDATTVPVGTTVTAQFDRDMLPSSITSSTFTLTPQLGNAVAATVSYSAATDTATLTPSSALDPSRLYTASLSTSVKGADGTAIAAEKTWSFTTNEAMTVSTKSPAPLATGVAPAVTVRATFSRAADASTITTSNVQLKTPSNTTVSSTVSYDASTKTVSLSPNASLALSTTYTVRLAGAIKATDNATLGADVTWTFTTAASAPAAPTISSTIPASGATGVPTDQVVTATFSRAMDPASITGQTVVLKDPSNNAVATTVAYNSGSNSASVTPTGLLAPGAVYTLQVTTGVRAADGTPLAATSTRTFTTADCPCTILNGVTPAVTGLDVSDGRVGSGLTYELGMKFTVTRTMRVTALRFYKDANETGTHVGRVWDAAGNQMTSVTFTGETASGWQQQALSTPVTLAANTTYVASVGLNAKFVFTGAGLGSAATNGPLSSVVGSNGVFGNSAGTFPTNSYNNSNYFVAPVVANPTTSVAPQVTTRAPVSGATGVDPGTTVTATFANAIDPSTLTASSFTLKTTAGGTSVPATVAWDAASRTATLTPGAALSGSTGYTATLTTALKSDDGTALPAAVTWAFTTAAPAPPTVTSKSPAAGATGVAVTAPVTATFSAAMDASTLTGTTVKLLTADASPVSATVAYDAVTKTVTLTPSAPLSMLATYTATITTGAQNAGGTALASAVTWTFTTAGCPCSAMSGLTPAATSLDVSDGRSGSGLTYELGTKIQVSTAASLTAVRFYKDAGENGTHVARVWDAAGNQITSATFTSETGSGWQQQALSSPVALSAGVTYVVSVGFNTKFVMTGGGLASARTSGPLSTVVGSNGVFGNSAGTFPTNSWNNSNYFVDAVVQ
jgi:Domain of unknown function (DUF4082)/Bacterial Ig-like domain